MESKKNNHGWNHGCKGSIHRYHRLVIKEIVIVTRSFHDRIYIASMGMNTSSRSTPTSPKHNLTFTSLFDNGISVESFTWWNTRWVWPVKTSEFTHIKEGIGSTHQGILGTYTTNFGVNNTSSKVEHGSQSRGYNLPKASCIRGKAHKLI